MKTENVRRVSAMVQLESEQLLAMTIVLCSHRQEPVEEPQPISETAWSRHCSWIRVNILPPKCNDQFGFGLSYSTGCEAVITGLLAQHRGN